MGYLENLSYPSPWIISHGALELPLRTDFGGRPQPLDPGLGRDNPFDDRLFEIIRGQVFCIA